MHALREDVAKIVRFLEEHRGANTVNNIRNQTKIDISGNVALQKSLQKNDKIIVHNNTYQYKVKEKTLNKKRQVLSKKKEKKINTNKTMKQPYVDNVHNKNDLCLYLSSNPQGVEENFIKDAYWGCEKDIADLIAQKRVIPFSNVLFWYPGILNSSDDPKDFFPIIDENIKKLWRDIKLPESKTELEKRLIDNQLLNDNNSGMNRKRKVKSSLLSSNPQKRRRLTNWTKYKKNITNQHLMVENKQKAKENDEVIHE
ncbi:hypothetical protein RFI_00977 [Reticulomyxa filosa]|uniref:TFIIE beta domain-containing protein n=1 Tax=Reticulomyxa filosa TaxID=46433 RepID=X6PD96_RETFI|nr:hypothetical protein RFI_00977 [Reticulomyxa filosa]|eukprot:ETO36083.1 hypothetical protein RFI_00977 [Reticulomyxa filosa]